MRMAMFDPNTNASKTWQHNPEPTEHGFVRISRAKVSQVHMEASKKRYQDSDRGLVETENDLQPDNGQSEQALKKCWEDFTA